MIVLYSTEGQVRLFEATVLDLISKRGLAVVGVGLASGASGGGRWASEASGGGGLLASEASGGGLSPSEARLLPVGLASSRRRRRIASLRYLFL